MPEGGKYFFHALAVALHIIVIVFSLGIALGGAIKADYKYLVAGLAGAAVFAYLLQDVIRNRPGIE